MFISSKEKISLTLRITVLEGRVEQLARSLNALHDAKTMSSDPSGLKLSVEAKRNKRNAYAREYYARKQAEKTKQSIF